MRSLSAYLHRPHRRAVHAVHFRRESTILAPAAVVFAFLVNGAAVAEQTLGVVALGAELAGHHAADIKEILQLVLGRLVVMTVGAVIVRAVLPEEVHVAQLHLFKALDFGEVVRDAGVDALAPTITRNGRHPGLATLRLRGRRGREVRCVHCSAGPCLKRRAGVHRSVRWRGRNRITRGGVGVLVVHSWCDSFICIIDWYWQSLVVLLLLLLLKYIDFTVTENAIEPGCLILGFQESEFAFKRYSFQKRD